MVVLLRERVIEMEADATTGGVGQPGGQPQAFVGRRRMIAEGLDGEGDGDDPKGGFLSAHPVRTAVRRIARHPVLERRPEQLDVAIGAVAQPGADEDMGPGEAGKLPDALDVIAAGVALTRPMGEGIRRTSREDAARPTVRPADFHQLMRKHAGITPGESVGFGDGRSAGFDGPGFELRGEVSAIESCDRQARRSRAPVGRIEAGREFRPRP